MKIPSVRELLMKGVMTDDETTRRLGVMLRGQEEKTRSGEMWWQLIDF